MEKSKKKQFKDTETARIIRECIYWYWAFKRKNNLEIYGWKRMNFILFTASTTILAYVLWTRFLIKALLEV